MISLPPGWLELFTIDRRIDESGERLRVPRHDSSSYEDEPLSAYAQRLRERNSPGQPGFRWRKKENVPTRYGFRAQPGVNTPGVDSDSSPLELFSFFFTEELMDMIVRETNRYHRQKPGPSSSHMKDWVDTSVSELGVFIGLRMAMGINQKPEQRSYWSTDLFYHSPLFPATMTRDRFVQLSRYLHVVDEGSHPPDDHLWKLRPAIEILQRQFSSVFTPPRRITVDESLEISGALCSHDLQHQQALALWGEGLQARGQ
ncbi:putative piggyBac transposable element-derived protein 4 [Penaeus vannamei]|uniref:Putative piggyBac transposable element-derived protein 4 n=1 Tax=Penaeus vannamei TaxID=6689 RepID=A0A423TQY5_PENVA|nr:putative piggyBac transposable element-derived protein 4 [Penaeus vannamei]